MIKGFLLENGIIAVVMNKQDSSYQLGEVELLVKKEDIQRAEEILNESNERNT